MRIIPERLDYLWFLGYQLDDPIPNHSVLSKARKRWGKEVFVSLFSRVVQQCVEAGLVEGRKIHVDASLVEANASLRSVKPLDPDLVKAIEQTAKAPIDATPFPPHPQLPDSCRLAAVTYSALYSAARRLGQYRSVSPSVLNKSGP
jgi:hypothetical protein